jgi:hypothetical protein
MPYLGDYIGHLLSEITTARVEADLESVRIADLYASHPLLKHMAVPRFRLPNVTVDVPVVVTQMDDAAAGQPLRGGIGIDDVNAAVERGLTAALDQSALKTTAKQKNDLRAAVTQSTAPFAPPAGAAISAGSVSDLVNAAGEAFAGTLGTRPGMSPDEAARLSLTFQQTVTAALQQSGHPVPRLSVAVTTGELREAGPPELLARLHLTVTEEAMEWSVSESGGKTTSRLVVE